MKKLKIRAKRQTRRKHHIRKRIFGTSERLRLTVFRSSKHIYAQIINDDESRTLVSASTLDKDVIEKITPEMKKKEQSRIVGEILGQKAVSAEIKRVAFDRNGFLFHGRIKELADAARKAGLEF